MKVKSLVKALVKNKCYTLARKIYKIILLDIIDFNDTEILNMIYSEGKKKDNNNLIYLYQELSKNGISTKGM